MKVPEQYRIKNMPVYGSDSTFGNNGLFIIPHYKINNYLFQCIACDLEGWEHVSVVVKPNDKDVTRCPTWEEMCWVKNQFWNEDEVVIQFHPAKSDYVNCHPFCLHLWRPTDQSLPMPDPLMVGEKQ